MTSHIRHQVCKNSIVPEKLLYSKTRRMVKNEAKLSTKMFFIYGLLQDPC